MNDIFEAEVERENICPECGGDMYNIYPESGVMHICPDCGYWSE